MKKIDKDINLNFKKNEIKNVKIIKNQKIKEKDLEYIYDYLKKEKINEIEEVEKADLVLSFGGDGTMLVAAKATIGYDVPIMAINMGTLGYLAEINPEDAIAMIENYKNGKYIIDQRNLLEVKYNKEKYYAVNELVISKGGLLSNLIEVEVFDNDVFINKYRADGVIVSTPTGSTAYSLSAGGSILHPSLEAMIITPLAPHSLNARSIVVDGNEKIGFLVFSRDNDACLNLDGNTVLKLDKSDNITAKLSNKKIKIIRSGKKDYYSILREKLKWGDSGIK